jgi:hypothetical protein
MVVYVYRDGKIVPKSSLRSATEKRSHLPVPRVSRLEPYESPIDGHEVTSWGERDRELKANDAYDPRDFKDRKNVRPEPQPDQPELPFWTDPV